MLVRGGRGECPVCLGVQSDGTDVCTSGESGREACWLGMDVGSLDESGSGGAPTCRGVR